MMGTNLESIILWSEVSNGNPCTRAVETVRVQKVAGIQ
jgi:hypothetical protein